MNSDFNKSVYNDEELYNKFDEYLTAVLVIQLLKNYKKLDISNSYITSELKMK